MTQFEGHQNRFPCSQTLTFFLCQKILYFDRYWLKIVGVSKKVERKMTLFSFIVCLWFSRQALFVDALMPIEAKKMTANIHIRSGVEFQPNSREGHDVESATARLSYFPRESSLQQVMSMNVNGQPEPSGGVLQRGTFNGNIFELHWDDPYTKSCAFDVSAVVQTTNEIVPVRNKVPFPIPHDLRDPSMDCYLQTNYEIVNNSPEIDRLAKRVVAGTDDLYHAVVRLADWVHANIRYSLETERREPYPYHKQKIQPSSQVLQSKYGKCDEQTALFLSLCRTVGIPTRFCRGYSCLRKPEEHGDRGPSDWGGHAWAEVFFPGSGWVPFDITKGEFGYLNCGNIMLGISEDATDYTVEYSARGRGVQIVTKPLDTIIQTEDMTCKETGSDGVRFYLESPTEIVPFGSTVILHATLQNDNDHYVCSRLDLAETVGARLLWGDAVSNVVLNPHEVKTVPFEIEINNQNLKPGYSYEFPFSIHSTNGKEAELCVKVLEDVRRRPGGQWQRPGSNNGPAPRHNEDRQLSSFQDPSPSWRDSAPFDSSNRAREGLGMENLVERQTFQSHDLGNKINPAEEDNGRRSSTRYRRAPQQTSRFSNNRQLPFLEKDKLTRRESPGGRRPTRLSDRNRGNYNDQLPNSSYDTGNTRTNNNLYDKNRVQNRNDYYSRDPNSYDTRKSRSIPADDRMGVVNYASEEQNSRLNQEQHNHGERHNKMLHSYDTKSTRRLMPEDENLGNASTVFTERDLRKQVNREQGHSKADQSKYGGYPNQRSNSYDTGNARHFMAGDANLGNTDFLERDIRKQMNRQGYNDNKNPRSDAESRYVLPFGGKQTIAGGEEIGRNDRPSDGPFPRGIRPQNYDDKLMNRELSERERPLPFENQNREDYYDHPSNRRPTWDENSRDRQPFFRNEEERRDKSYGNESTGGLMFQEYMHPEGAGKGSF